MRILCVFGKHSYGEASRGEGYEFVNFIPALMQLGHEVSLFDSWDRSTYRNFADLNRAFLSRVLNDQPEIIFCVLMGYELWIQTLELARSVSNARILNWGTDDSWKYDEFTRFVAPHVDLYVTTYPEAAERGVQEGIENIVVSQWAASQAVLAEPIPAKQCNYSVTFVGSAYGNRRRWIDRLSAKGVEVQCFGHGWPNGPVSSKDLIQIYRHSQITLNFGDSALHFGRLRPFRSRQLKARVFEVPGVGGCLLTENAPHLDRYFNLGREIVAFEGMNDLVDSIERLLSNPDQRDAIAFNGYHRVLREHTYNLRFADLLQKIEEPRALKPQRSLQWAVFDEISQAHRLSFPLRCLRILIVLTARLVWGPLRGARAARRLMFELSWRFFGSYTYTSAGWPGRMFYRES